MRIASPLLLASLLALPTASTAFAQAYAPGGAMPSASGSMLGAPQAGYVEGAAFMPQQQMPAMYIPGPGVMQAGYPSPAPTPDPYGGYGAAPMSGAGFPQAGGYGPEAYGPMPGGESGYAPGGCAPGGYGAAGYGDPSYYGSGGILPDDYYGGGFQRYWLDASYVNYRGKGDEIPALVTTSPVGTPQNQAGVLNRPGTDILIGNQGINDDHRSGIRVAAGFWAGDGVEDIGYEVHYTAIADADTSFALSSYFSGSGDTILARPFYNTLLGQQDAVVLAFPDFFRFGLPADLNGAISIDSHNEMQTGGVQRRDLMWLDRSIGYSSYFLTGYRYFGMDEHTAIRDRITPVGGVFASGSRIDSYDLFQVENDFHGLDLGVDTNYTWGPWSFGVLTKLALGNSHQVANIRGRTTTFDGFTRTTSEGGLLAQESNIGRRSQNHFALVPEFNLEAAYRFTPNFKATVGYNFIYYSHVVRPGSLMGLAVNPSQFDGGTLVGEEAPIRHMSDTDFYVHGVNAGVEWNW